MNLNVLTNIMDYFQGNISKVEDSCNKSEFSGLFDMMEGSFEDIEGQLNINIEDSEANIDENLLQSILSSLNIYSLNNLNSMPNKSTQDINSLIEKLNSLEAENLIGNLLLNDNQDKLNLSEDIFTNLMEDLSVDEKILNLRQSLEAESISIEENRASNFIEEAINIQDDARDQSIDNQRNSIIDAVNIEESYNQLETNSLSNKSNLFNSNEHESENDELETLEDVLKKESNNFIGFDSVVSKTENTSSKVGIDSTPVREVRQEAIGDDIVQTVKYLKENGLEEIKVKINPRELGEMTIKIMKSAEETKLSITISNEDIYDLVNKNSSEISNHLKNLDINVKEIVVQVKNNNENLFSENFSQEFDKKNQNKEKNKKNKLQENEIEVTEGIDSLEVNNNLNILI